MTDFLLPTGPNPATSGYFACCPDVEIVVSGVNEPAPGARHHSYPARERGGLGQTRAVISGAMIGVPIPVAMS